VSTDLPKPDNTRTPVDGLRDNANTVTPGVPSGSVSASNPVLPRSPNSSPYR
jgi:hypothetical protein